MAFDLNEMEKRMLEKLRPRKPALFQGLRDAAKRIAKPKKPRLPRI